MHSVSAKDIRRARFGAAAGTLIALLTVASGAQAALTVGNTPATTPTATCAIKSFDAVEPDPVTGGNSYVVPENGSITSWSTFAAAGAGQQLAMKVFRKVGDPVSYSVVGADSRGLTPSQLNTFAVSIPVKAGDLIGSNDGPTGSPSTACTFFGTAPTTIIEHHDDVPVGQTASFDLPLVGNDLLNVTATIEPTSQFTVGATAADKKKGTASISLTLPNPGAISVSGTGIKPVSASVAAAGPATVTIEASGKAKKKLKKSGKTSVSPAISFTPANGMAATQTVAIKLKKKKKKKRKH